VVVVVAAVGNVPAPRLIVLRPRGCDRSDVRERRRQPCRRGNLEVSTAVSGLVRPDVLPGGRHVERTQNETPAAFHVGGIERDRRTPALAHPVEPRREPLIGARPPACPRTLQRPAAILLEPEPWRNRQHGPPQT